MSGSDADRAALRRRRRLWAPEETRRIVDESLADRASIAEVARHYDLNGNQLFTWRRQFGVEPAAPKELAPILPGTVAPDTTAQYPDPGSNGQMEILLTDGDRIIVWADVETAALSRVVSKRDLMTARAMRRWAGARPFPISMGAIRRVLRSDDRRCGR
jgi:transposase